MNDRLEIKQSTIGRPPAQTHECEFPNCRTLVLHHHYCARHRPQAEWQISAEVRAEIDGEQRQNEGEQNR